MSTVAKPRQLNVDELLRLKWLLGGTMSLVALWTVFFLDIEALSLVAIASSLVAAAVIWPGIPGRIPPVVGRLAVPAIVIVAAVDFYLSPDTLPVLIRVAILLVLYRAVGYRRKREDLQLLVLGLFLIVVAGVLTVSLGFAFLLLGFTAVALGFLFVINLVDAAESGALRTSDAATAWTRLRWGRFLARLREVADWRLLTFAGVLFAMVVGLSGLLFLLIPRFDLATGFFLDRYITRKSRSGFSETVRFGDVTELTRDESVAMRVDLADASGIREAPYWRLVVLDEYTPDGFRVSVRLKNQLIASERITQMLSGGVTPRYSSETGGAWTFYLEPGVSRYLPLPGGFGRLRLRDAAHVQHSVVNRIVALRTEPMTMTAFQLDGVTLDRAARDLSFGAWLADSRRPNYRPSERSYDPRIVLAGPEGEASEAVLRRIVREISGGSELGPEAFAERATAWIRARHAYALSVHIPAGRGDTIVRWLDSNEPGFCEYFAAGLTVLLRAAGHPARVIAGFHGGVLNAFEGYFMVKNSDAHAWVEVYDGRAAWVRFDPTPGGGASATRSVESVQQDQDSSWSARWDSLRVLWYRRIVNFDSRQQVQMIEQVKAITAGSGTALRQQLEQWTKLLKDWLRGPWSARRTTEVAAIALASGGLGWLLVRGWRSARGRWWSRHPEGDPVRRVAGQWLNRLRAQPRNAVADVLPDLQRLRYGRRETWPEPRTVFKRARGARRRARPAGE